MELSFNKAAEKIGHSKSQPVGTNCGWGSEAIYSSANLYFDDLLNDINAAESSIELVVYIFTLDETGLRFTDTLTRASRIFRSNYSLRLRRLSNRLLAVKIRNAKQRVWICSAYFSPSAAVIRAIKAAKSKNVDVRLVVAGRSDITLFPLLSSTYYADLLKIGVSIYRYQAGILHAKAMLVDQECLIGSTNLNHRSFHHDLELDVVLSMSESIDRIKFLLEQDMQNSLQLSQHNVTIWGRFMLFGWILRIIRYWL